MANSKLVFMVSPILLAIIFCSGTFSTLGRPLKTENKEQVTTYKNSIEEMATVAENIALWRRHTLEFEAATTPDTKNDGVGNWIDDFRPTVPGHSPGAGH